MSNEFVYNIMSAETSSAGPPVDLIISLVLVFMHFSSKIFANVSQH